VRINQSEQPVPYLAVIVIGQYQHWTVVIDWLMVRAI
jgi:hypothetical protein